MSVGRMKWERWRGEGVSCECGKMKWERWRGEGMSCECGEDEVGKVERGGGEL